ncbi:MAG: gfo/Idh/MocA family oxidoreductase, partial [Pedobacter sp.]|nr:gfo/Idh/MocA family oxidoreductase [Pedobacter sp.]
IVGTEGIIELGYGAMKVKSFKRPKAPEFGGYDSVSTFSQAQQEESAKAYKALFSDEDKKWNYAKEITFKVPEGYDERLDHFINFFESIRTGKKVAEDATFGLRAAAPALACNLSAALKKPILWDAEKMKIV